MYAFISLLFLSISMRFGLPASLKFSECGVTFLYKDAFAQLMRRCVNSTSISLSLLDGQKREKSPSDPYLGVLVPYGYRLARVVYFSDALAHVAYYYYYRIA